MRSLSDQGCIYTSSDTWNYQQSGRSSCLTLINSSHWEMLCQPTDDRDVGWYTKIACDLVHVTVYDQSGVSHSRLCKMSNSTLRSVDSWCLVTKGKPWGWGWKKKLYRWWRLSTATSPIPYGHSTDGSLIRCRHTTCTCNAFDTRSTLEWHLTDVVTNMSTDTVNWDVGLYVGQHHPYKIRVPWCLICYRSKLIDI